MSEEQDKLPEWLTSAEAVDDERIAIIDLQIGYYEGKFPVFQTPLEWAEEMLKVANMLVESYNKLIADLKEGKEGGS